MKQVISDLEFSNSFIFEALTGHWKSTFLRKTFVNNPIRVGWSTFFCRWVKIICTNVVLVCWSVSKLNLLLNLQTVGRNHVWEGATEESLKRVACQWKEKIHFLPQFWDIRTKVLHKFRIWQDWMSEFWTKFDLLLWDFMIKIWMQLSEGDEDKLISPKRDGCSFGEPFQTGCVRKARVN